MNIKRSKRLIRLLAIVRRIPKRIFTNKELTREYNVGVRTIQRDMVLLNAAGYGIEYTKGIGWSKI